MNDDAGTGDAGFGLRPGELRLVTVGPEWARRFEAERERLSAALGRDALDIQHVGSTAVPGLAAKPILDIAVAVRDFGEGHALVPRITALGYEYRGEYGIARRHYFVRGSAVRTHHLHVYELHGADWGRHLRFRDLLRASPELAARYADLKRAIAADAQDRDEYQRRKSAFIDGVESGD